MKTLKQIGRWLLGGAVVFATAIVAIYIWTFTPDGQRDTCLDGGGRWNEGDCEGGLHGRPVAVE